MVDFKGLLKGMSAVQVFAGAMLGFYAVVIIATIFLGILTDVGQNITSINAQFNATLNATATSYNELIQTLFDPVAVMIQLVIVVVLLVIFFKGGLPGSTSKDVV